MTAVIVPACLLAYFASALFAARWLYGYLRARGIDANIRDYPSLHGYGRDAGKAVREWNRADRPPVILVAVISGLVWPAVVPAVAAGWLLVRFLNTTPILSRAEMAERATRRDRRIAELERENERLRRQQEDEL